MGNRLDKDRQQKLEPQRINHSVTKITELGLEIVQRDSTKIVFMFKGSKIQFFCYSGWHSGKKITDGRGLDNLLKQLKDGK